MADDTLVEGWARKACRLTCFNCDSDGPCRGTLGSVQLGGKLLELRAAVAAIEQTHALISREPTEAEIEAMAPGIYDRINLFYHSDTLAPWPEALECHRNIALDAARAAHAGLVEGQ